jgi:hypothetical protein
VKWVTSAGAWASRLLLGAVLLTTTACRGGCARDAGTTPAGVLAAFPGEARTVVAVDFARVRASPLWQRLAALAADDPEDQRIIQGLVARTGLDPFEDIRRLVAAFPEEARRDGAFGLVFHGDHLDQDRLLDYARDEARQRGHSLGSRPRAGFTLWSAGGDAAVAGFFLDRRRFVLGGGGWAERMADLAGGAAPPSASAGANAALVALAERVGRDRAVWLAAVVPEATRARLQADPRFGTQASVMRLGAGLDLAPGLRGKLSAELNNAADARALVARADQFLRAARKSPRALLLGAGPYLDGIRVAADGAEVIVTVELDAAQTAELATRLEALARGGQSQK